MATKNRTTRAPAPQPAASTPETPMQDTTTETSSAPAAESQGTQDVVESAAPQNVVVNEPTPEETPVAAQPDAAVETPKEPEPVAQSAVQELVDPIISELGIPAAKRYLQNVPAANYAVLATLNAYARAMDPTHPITEAEGARMQVGLLRVITNLINREETHFEGIFRVVLAWFEKNADGCLHPRAAHRFLHLMPVSEDDLRAFNNLVDMLRLLAPAPSRALAKKQLNAERAMQYGLTDPGRQRLRNFFDL